MRRRNGNQYNKNWTDEQYLEYKELKRQYKEAYDRVIRLKNLLKKDIENTARYKGIYASVRKSKDIVASEWHSLEGDNKKAMKNRFNVSYRNVKIAKINWHNYKNKEKDTREWLKKAIAVRNDLSNKIKEFPEFIQN